ncbi:MAG: STAS domain-containing protein [Planctomycetota bacterium]|jgi:anti-anti-sigma regulatory factor
MADEVIRFDDQAEEQKDERFQLKPSADPMAAVLEVACERLARKDTEAFQAACEELLKTGKQELVIDGHHLHMISSVFIGVLINIGTQAKSAGGHLVLVCTQSISDVLHKLVGDTLEIRVQND